MKYFNSDNGAMYKGDNTIVTLADKEINSYLIKRVKEQYPTHSVDGEEEMFGESKYVWVCDPIDGTAMYGSFLIGEKPRRVTQSESSSLYLMQERSKILLS